MFKSEIFIDRILLFFGMLIYPFWGYVFLNINPNFYDPISHRIIISAAIFFVLICTFFLEQKRNLLDFMMYIIIYVVSFKQVLLIHQNELSIEYFLGFLIIVVSLIAYFKTVKQILSYSLFCVLLILLVFVVEKNVNFNIFIFYISSIFTVSFFLSVIYLVKVTNQQKLIDFSEQLKENEEKYKVLFESVPDGIITVNKEGKVVNANKRALEMFEYDFDDICEKGIEQLIPEKYRNAHVRDRNNYQKQPNQREMGTGKSLFALAKNGKEFPVEISLSPVINNSSEYKVIALIRDVSQKIETQKELTEVRVKLQQKEVAEKLSQAKSEFISKMSHEIRTPLNGIYGFTNILLQEKLDEKQKKYLESILFSSNILKTLIDDILDNTNIESGKIRLQSEELNIVELFNLVIHNFDLQIANKKIHLENNFNIDITNDDIIVLGDKLRISQIIMNLLSNAIKFSDDGKPIKIDVKTQNYSETKLLLLISISNYGISIPQDKLEEIFEPYAQLTNDVTQKYGGTGLGLSIVKNLVTLMKGEITVTSGDLTTFNIAIPLEKKIRKKLEKSETKQVKSKSGIVYNNILVAEDNVLNQFLIKTILEKNKFNFKLVENGKEVIDALSEGNYDLILMDIQMPEMDGVTCAKLIKEKGIFKIPIIALTADVRNKNNEEYLDLFDGVITKPYNEEELVKTILEI